jgi:hypothetical protein
MFRNIFLGASALALVACVQAEAPAPVTVSNVEVDVDLTAVASRQAAARWATLETDIAAALDQEFVGMTSPEGYLVKVDVDELSLATLGGDDARLTGTAQMVDIFREQVVRSFAVSASANEAAAFLPPGQTSVSPTSQEFYAAVVRAFARGVAQVVRSGPAEPS